MKSHEKIVAIVVAGGKGARAGFSRPKQFAPIRGVPMAARALMPFVRHPQVSAVVLAVHPDRENESAKALAAAAQSPQFSKLHSVRIAPTGKESRAQTVAAALCESCDDDHWALVHDAARPFLESALLSKVIAAALRDGIGAAPLSPVSQALKKADDSGKIVESIPRAGLFLAQTPQMFRAGLLKTALAKAPDADDECDAMHRAGFQFQSVPGDSRNIKLTYPADFALAEALAGEADRAEGRAA